MLSHNIIVIGASAGGFEAFRKIIGNLPPDFQASIFIVWHMAPHIRGVLPQVLNRENTIYAAHAYDGELIEPARIYIAPPDRHMLIEDGIIRITKGPKENRFRPAVDPLFRSAAYSFGNRVIGVILSGALDDGTSGLWTIKHRGGIAVVQDPMDAEVPSMPESASREVDVDYIVPVAEIGSLLVKLTDEEVGEPVPIQTPVDDQNKIEIRIAREDNALQSGIMEYGEFTPFTCPECHGVLSKYMDGVRARFRCHTGHAFSADSLLASVTESIEESLYSAVRGVEESVMLLNHIGDHYAEINQPKLAAIYFQKAKEAQARSELVRQAVMQHEQYSKDSLRQEAAQNGEEKRGESE